MMGDTPRVDYDAIASGYNRRYSSFRYDEIERAIEAFLKAGAGSPEYIEAPSGLAVLEVGCGTGHWLTWLNSLAGRVGRRIGIDASRGMLERATASGAWLLQGRAEDLPLADASLDRVFVVHALHHFSDRARFLREARRVLRPGGGLLMLGLDPHAERDTWWIYDYFPEARTVDLKRYPAVRTIRGETSIAGFAWCESYEAQLVENVMPASRAFETGLVDPRYSSQLAVIGDEKFREGERRLREELEAAEKGAGQLMLTTELHVFAVTAWVGGS